MSGVAGVIVALQSVWWVAVAVMAVWGVAYQMVVMNSISYRQQVTPDSLQGRVNTAGRVLSFGVGWSAGAAVAGLLATWVGLRPAMLAMVSVGVLAAGYAWSSPLPRLSALPLTDGRAFRSGGK